MLARLSGDIIIALKMERWIWLFIVAGWIFFFLVFCVHRPRFWSFD